MERGFRAARKGLRFLDQFIERFIVSCFVFSGVGIWMSFLFRIPKISFSNSRNNARTSWSLFRLQATVATWEFPKIRVPCLRVLIIRILLFSVLYMGPLFSETPTCCKRKPYGCLTV